MDIKSASNILFGVRDDPRTKGAQSYLAQEQREVEKIEQSIAGDYSVKQANYPNELNAMWKNNPVAQPLGMVALLGVLGCGLAARAAVTMIPGAGGLALLGFVGGLVAGWKYGVPIMGKYVLAPIIRRSVNKQMNRYLDVQLKTAQAYVAHAQRQLDQTVKAVTAELSARAEAEELANAGKVQPDATVTVDDTQVKLGNISVPRRA